MKNSPKLFLFIGFCLTVGPKCGLVSAPSSSKTVLGVGGDGATGQEQSQACMLGMNIGNPLFSRVFKQSCLRSRGERREDGFFFSTVCSTGILNSSVFSL